MADNTRMKAIDEACKKNEKQIEQLSNQNSQKFEQQELLVNELRKETADLRRDLDAKFDRVFNYLNLEKQKDISNNNDERSSNATQLGSQSEFISPSLIFHPEQAVATPLINTDNESPHKIPQQEFPRFEGVNPRVWSRKCSTYFSIYNLPERLKVTLAAMYFSGKADIWYQDYIVGKSPRNWEEFVNDVTARFQEVEHDNVVGEFNKLQQDGTVLEYLERFEELKALMLTKNQRLSEEYFIMSFLSGLKKEIQSMVQLFHPITLNQAVVLAKRHEGHDSFPI